MEIRAYPEIYLHRAQLLLGEMIDYAVNHAHFSGTEFIDLFLVSSYCPRFEKGEAAVLMGKSGPELFSDVVFDVTGKMPEIDTVVSYSRSPEYWIGWAAAYYQWYSDRRFMTIFSAITYDDFLILYQTLHEADISKFVEIAEKRIRSVYPDTNLKRIRSYYGCSQSALARESGVGLRAIQMYEQRKKDINKASAESLYRLSKVLGCTVEDLLEHS